MLSWSNWECKAFFDSVFEFQVFSVAHIYIYIHTLSPGNKKNDSKKPRYSKTKGNAGRENKYDLPPPMDSPLFFGNMILIRYDGCGDEKKPQHFTKTQWESVYTHLFGGFEDLNDEDEEEEEEEDIDPSKLDKYGYEKDGFVVYSDNATYFKNDDIIVTKGNTQGKNGNNNITAKDFRFNRKKNILIAENKVKFEEENDGFVVYSDNVTYF